MSSVSQNQSVFVFVFCAAGGQGSLGSEVYEVQVLSSGEEVFCRNIVIKEEHFLS